MHKEQKIPGTIKHHRMITPEGLSRRGATHTINSAQDDLRNTLQQILSAPRGTRTPIVHIYITTVEQLTDSAGAEITTRDRPDRWPGDYQTR